MREQQHEEAILSYGLRTSGRSVVLQKWGTAEELEAWVKANAHRLDAALLRAHDGSSRALSEIVGQLGLSAQRRRDATHGG